MPKRSLADQLDQAVTQLLAARIVTVQSAEPELLPLLHIAAELRQLPREDFKERLKADLGRSTSMATTDRTCYRSADRGIPAAHFQGPGKAIEFYKQAFGAKETFRFENEMGIGHAEIMIGDSVIMIAGEWPDGERFSAETLGSSPIWMTILVPDVDAFAAHAVAAGARLQGAIADQFYGRRDANSSRPLRIHLERVHGKRRNVGRGDASPLQRDDEGTGKEKAGG